MFKKWSDWLFETETKRIWFSVLATLFLDIALISWAEVIAILQSSEYDRGVLMVLFVVLLSVVNYVACTWQWHDDAQDNLDSIRMARKYGIILSVSAFIAMLGEWIMLSYLILILTSVLTGYWLSIFLHMRDKTSLSDIQGDRRVS